MNREYSKLDPIALKLMKNVEKIIAEYYLKICYLF
jgi:hypothetical protein